MTNCLVIDLGAGSGRAMVAAFDGTRLTLDEVHRFGGYAVEREDGPRWDWPALLSHIGESIRRAQASVGRIDSIGVDSWGVDYVLLDEVGAVMAEPHHYRHPRSHRGYEAFPLPPSALFALTGAQDLAVNTIYQLHDEAKHHPAHLNRAYVLLMMADAVNHHLTGNLRSEITLARTSALIASDTADWHWPLCKQLGLPVRLLQPVIAPGEIYGYVRPEISATLQDAGAPPDQPGLLPPSPGRGRWRAERATDGFDAQTGWHSSKASRFPGNPTRHPSGATLPNASRRGKMEPSGTPEPKTTGNTRGSVPVIAVAAHDTSSAVAALSLDDGSGFLICGSWCLIGIEQDRPVLSDAIRRAGFGNEGGVEGRTFLVKSLNGLQLIQKLRTAWELRSGVDIDFGDLSERARAALVRGDVSPIDPSDPLFFNPADIVDAIGQFFAPRGIAVPDDSGWLAASVYTGLAGEVGRAARALEEALGITIPRFRLCGGGAHDGLLCELLAGALDRPARVGPIEASAWGNAVVQLMGLGLIETLNEGRRLIERSAVFHDVESVRTPIG